MMGRRRFGKPCMQAAVIVFAKENRLAVVAVLDHVQRLIGQEVAAEPCHASLVGGEHNPFQRQNAARNAAKPYCEPKENDTDPNSL